METTPAPVARAGVNIEIVTVIWMVIEAIIAIGAGILAGSVLLTAFGLDSVIELVSGGVLLWRLSLEAARGSLERVERAERIAAWVTAISLALLCVYVLVLAAFDLVTGRRPESSLVGIGISLAALIVMPILVAKKRRIAKQLGSAALRADAACSLTCAYLAGAVLVGLSLNALLGWWWAEDMAALVFLYWLIKETHEALEHARSGRACGCGESCES
jgi:divalent metal cation (Fe/Co/Zn/Cd) transporter